ncbi:MAG: hypothetical protein JXR51_09030 [Bacteroidales bacterium]|nr:hypothetical protein [Bacteroidales bacterium]
MKNLIYKWLIPLLLAIIFVAILQIFFIDVLFINIDNKNHIALILKSKRAKRGNFILYTKHNDTIIQFNRCVAVPQDNLFIKNSTLFINNFEKSYSNEKHEFILKSDSNINLISKYLESNNIEFDKNYAEFSIFNVNLNKKDLKKFKRTKIFNNINLIYDKNSLYSDDTYPYNKHFYWNKDNFGPIPIPFKGKKISINRINYFLYKSIIEIETGNKFIVKNNKFLLNNKEVLDYTFKENYYFALNDNRSNANDSRSYGFISEKDILAKLIFKIKF